ncbi:uncharacterized protein LOC123292392 isoform X2 [Chrysoperla carnea]|uniref:uncharacterized protein LOC123292392 isoform X2 n=1 Tax=Chrysoperla carnea TaxID=189513 RepID=UPI001D098515|nr:uncharacterized protein LOC123292392 isoform X2 [Chrysoperla carnea]
MIYLILILLCGVSSHIIPQRTTQISSSFLKEYETLTQGLPVAKFDGLQEYLEKNCNLTIPSVAPKFSFAEVNSMLLHYCIGIRESVERLRNDYQDKKLKESINEFFNRSSLQIMNDLRNTSNDVCTNFNNIVLENKNSQWMENLRSHFNQSQQCIMSCVTDDKDNIIAEQCIFIYGLQKTLHSLESKVNLQTTTHAVSTDSHKSEKNEVMVPLVNSAPQEEMRPVKNPEPPADEKSDIVKVPVKQQKEENLVQLPPQKPEDTHPANLNKAAVVEPDQDDPVGVDDTERFRIPTTISTTAKNVVKGSSTVVNQVNPSPPKQEVVQPSKTEDEHKAAVDNVENVNPKVPKSQGQESEFLNEYPAQDFEDDKDDGDFEKPDWLVVDDPNDPKTKSHKKVTNEEVFQKPIQSFGTKPVTAQEVDTEVSLMPWYLMVVFCAFLVYLSFANKKKIVAYVVEGRPSGRYGRRGGRPNTANYRKLDTNLEEAITSNCNTTSSHVIY